ncbi:MAG: carbonic anhydrase [Bacteroidetes bacterium]|nr:carbonic anhydrase [Bacteroidota bacterium]MDA1332772.1 carbonic anhydrase [Bacteroidota bacterium]
MIPATEALARLKEGNKRYLSGGHARSAIDMQKMRDDLADGQAPFAVVLSCSDSRVPTEYVFDQHLGDLFVIRVAGNIVEPSQIASVEFAVEQLGTRLIVVMGHTRCGAVQAALKAMEDPEFKFSIHMEAIVNRVETAIRSEPAFDSAQSHEEKCRIAGHANVEHSVERLYSKSESLAALISSGDVMCIGAEYSVETGIVSWL